VLRSLRRRVSPEEILSIDDGIRFGVLVGRDPLAVLEDIVDPEASLEAATGTEQKDRSTRISSVPHPPVAASKLVKKKRRGDVPNLSVPRITPTPTKAHPYPFDSLAILVGMHVTVGNDLDLFELLTAVGRDLTGSGLEDAILKEARVVFGRARALIDDAEGEGIAVERGEELRNKRETERV
jgi:hypothetical protein